MRKLLTSTAVVLAALSGMSPALAQSSSYTLYTTIYYDTPSFDNQVGIIRGQCGRNGPRYTLTGIQTPYSEEFEVGTCGDGGLEPL